jgi:hypothetical protein
MPCTRYTRLHEGEDTPEKRLPIAKQLKVGCFVSKIGRILLANSKSLSFSALIFGKAQERLD